MYAKCIKCGSENTHRSRIRSGERTAGMFFLKPVRCRDCKERFWVRNPSAYFSAAALLAFFALVITTIWLVVEENTGSSVTLDASKSGPDQPPNTHTANSANSTNNGRLVAGAGENRSNVSSSVRSSSTPQPLNRVSPPSMKARNDHEFTVQLYQDSAENGEADAQYKLGLLYLTGNGALQDFAEAAKWLKRAAEQGYALAQYELGLIYRTGYGLGVDPVKSYMWLNLAAAAGIQQAVAARDEVMRSLNSNQLAQAQKVSREWLASRTRRETASKATGKAKLETDAEAIE
jgi:uncharacterized protein